MLIGIDASRANRKFKGGTEWYSFYLIREMAKIDAKNQYILYSDQPLEDDLANLISRRNNFKAKILNWPFTFFWTQIRLSWEMLIRPAEVLFIPAHTLPLIHPKKSVVTIHDIGFERDCDLYSSDKIGPAGVKGKAFDFLARLFTLGKFSSNTLDYHRWSTKFALKHAAAIIAVSNFTKQEIMNVYGTDSDKIKVVHNGYNDEIYKNNLEREKIGLVLSDYGIHSSYILYVGRLEKKKNTPLLVHAYALMREKYKNLDYKLVLAGNASLGFDEVKYMIEEFDLNNEVIVTGWVKESDMPYLYSGASLFVFPSRYEGFGIPLLQAMASGVPIAASGAASIPEVVGTTALLFDPKDKNELAEKMAAILLNKNLASVLAKKGGERVKNFSLAKCAHETLELIENL